jgi:phosphate:Na+ symporter
MMLPFTSLLEKLAMKVIPEPKSGDNDVKTLLDDRLMTTPAVAIDRSREITMKMARVSGEALKLALEDLEKYTIANAEKIRELETEADHYEDILGEYLVRLGTHPLSDRDRAISARLLHSIGDLERISDHAVNIIESVEELNAKQISFTEMADKELKVLIRAVRDIVNKTLEAFQNNNYILAKDVEPLEEVIDDLKDKLKKGHILRLQKGDCTIEVGFVWSDLLGNMERISDHCSNIAGLVTPDESFGIHEYLGQVRSLDKSYHEKFEEYSKIYAIE